MMNDAHQEARVYMMFKAHQEARLYMMYKAHQEAKVYLSLHDEQGPSRGAALLAGWLRDGLGNFTQSWVS